MKLNSQRLSEIDLMRGFALLGIFLMNVGFMGNSNLIENKDVNYSNAFDLISDKLEFLFLAQRFIGIFSLLFGLSIAMQQQKFKDLQISFNDYYFKRTGILFLIGIIQILFFYMGDVLFLYSVFSIILFLLFRLPNRFLIVLSILLFFIPAILESVESYQWIINSYSENAKNYYTSESLIKTYQLGTLIEMMKARVVEFYYYDLTDIIWSRTSLSMIIIGYVIGRNNLHKSYLDYWNKLKAAFAVCFSIYISFIIYFLVSDVHFGFWINMIYNFHILISITTYVLLILFLNKINFLKRINALIINVGKMSLSNYLIQSIICSFIFTNYGFGLFSKTSPTYNILIVLSIYSLQIILSYLYLKRYKMGPLEYLWRRLSYK